MVITVCPASAIGGQKPGAAAGGQILRMSADSFAHQHRVRYPSLTFRRRCRIGAFLASSHPGQHVVHERARSLGGLSVVAGGDVLDQGSVDDFVPRDVCGGLDTGRDGFN